MSPLGSEPASPSKPPGSVELEVGGEPSAPRDITCERCRKCGRVAVSRGLGKGRGPDDEVGDTGDRKQNRGDQKKETESREFFAFRRVAGNFEKEQEKPGYGKEHEPDRNAGEFGGNRPHGFMERL